MDTKIRQFVYRVRSRLREQLVVDNLIKFVIGGMFIAVFVSLVALVVPFYYAIMVATIVLVTFFFAGIIWSVRKTPTPMQAALKADAKGYQEKLSTAFFLVGKEDPFSLLQKKDALRIVEQFQIRKEFPIRLVWKRVGVMLLLTAVFVVTSLLDTPAKREAAIQHDVKQEAKEEIARIEKVQKELEKNPELDQNEVADIKEQLENAKQELKEAENYDELQKAEERINKKMEMASREVKDQTLGEMMQQAAQEAEESAQEEEEQLAEEVKEALEKAQNGDERDKQEAYEKMKKLAAKTGDEQLAQAAEAYKESQYSDSAYANATQSLNQNRQNSDYAQNNNNQSNNSSQNNTNNSNNNSNTNQNSNNQNNSQNNSGNQSQGNNGQGNGNQGNNGQNGDGQGSGSGNGNGSGNGSGPGWNYGGREGQEGERKTREDITIPDGEVGDDDNLTGKGNDNDSSTKQKSSQSKTWSGNKVSYDEVSGKYKEKAHKKVNGSNYPSKMKDRIKRYFDGLN